MIGDLVTISYYDHIAFCHSANPANLEPIINWTIGVVANETADYITLLHEIYPNSTADCKVPKANGLVIRKTDVIEVTKLLAKSKRQPNRTLSKGIKIIKPTQPSSMRPQGRKTQQTGACKK